MQRQLGGDHAVQCLAVRPGGTSDLVIAACTDNRARLYDPRASSSGVATKTFSGHKQWLYAAAWLWRSDEVESHGGNFFATASEDATVRLWDLRCTTHALLTLDRLHTDGVLDLTYAGAGTIVSCGKDNSTKSSQCTKGTELLC
ncbi:WD domain [Trypanosoma vivax]|nr:WD domain [Trypanosoma vivax]